MFQPRFLCIPHSGSHAHTEHEHVTAHHSKLKASGSALQDDAAGWRNKQLFITLKKNIAIVSELNIRDDDDADDRIHSANLRLSHFSNATAAEKREEWKDLTEEQQGTGVNKFSRLLWWCVGVQRCSIFNWIFVPVFNLFMTLSVFIWVKLFDLKYVYFFKIPKLILCLSFLLTMKRSCNLTYSLCWDLICFL